MKLFKKEIFNVVKTYTSNISNKINIPEDELYELLLIRNESSKTKKINTTGYIMLVKKTHETCDDKSKLIGNAWCSLTTDKNLEYNEKDYCTFINIKKDKKCNKFVCEYDKLLCKKHYKLHLKKIEKSKKIKDITENIIDINQYTNSSVKFIIHDDKEMYIDYFNNIYIIDNDNNANLIGKIDINGEYIIFKTKQ